VSRALLVYDGSTPAFRTLAEAVTGGVDGLRPVPWEDDRVQAFLAAQFDGRPFAFLLVEGDSVHVGDAAVERVLERYGADAVAPLAKRLYPSAAGPFGRIVHGREPADYHGTFEVTETAAEHLESLRRTYEIPVEEAE